MLRLSCKWCRVDHTSVVERSNDKVTILVVYVDGIAVRGNDETEIAHLKTHLGKEFEIKYLGLLKYFFGIEVPR